MTGSRSRCAAALIAATLMVLLCGCARHNVTLYQNGVKLGEWELRDSWRGAVTASGKHVVVRPARGIPLDTVTVEGGLAVVETDN